MPRRGKPEKTFHERKAIRAKRVEPKRPPIPPEVEAQVEEWINRFNKFSLERRGRLMNPKQVYDGLKMHFGEHTNFVNWRFRRYKTDYRRWRSTRKKIKPSRPPPGGELGRGIV